MSQMVHNFGARPNLGPAVLVAKQARATSVSSRRINTYDVSAIADST